MPENALYVGRPTVFGNPFKIGVHGNRQECLDKFRRCVTEGDFVSEEIWDLWQQAGGSVGWLVGIIRNPPLLEKQLRGYDLACWCPENSPCHADILLELANK